MKERVIKIISTKKVILVIYILFAVIASIQSLIGTKTYYEGGKEYNRYNNYTIFQKSFEHLKNNQDLYVLYPEEHWDFYKYTPSFSVFFGLFNIFPDWLGLNLWNILNALVLALAVYYLPKLNNYQKGLILIIAIIELMTSMQSSQSNALIAGLLILTFGLLEKNKPFFASLCVVFSLFIKPFGMVGFALFLFYRKKWNSVLYALTWFAILFFIPLLFVGFEQYLKLYNSYFKLLALDYDTNAMFPTIGNSYGISVMGWLHSWFSIDVAKNYIMAIGVVIFLLPFFKINMYKEFMFKYLLLCSILIWIVIFNHKAESPTFIIAMAGVTLWFVKIEKNKLNIILFINAFILTTLSSTDLFPKYLREEFVKPYNLKAFPCILIWLKIIYDMLKLKKKNAQQSILHN
ncbi:MAG: glycosyltransferase family 87 protein [Bacteroidota bacterium]